MATNLKGEAPRTRVFDHRLTLKEVCEMLHISAEQVEKLKQLGLLLWRPVKKGGLRGYLYSQVMHIKAKILAFYESRPRILAVV